MAKLRYRPDVDGLRAVAVAGVMLFHLGVPHIGGGFFGVDVFFVISGYLITSLLFVEFAASGRIDFANFWARRTRRILPSALLVIAVTLIAASFVVSDLTLFYAARDAIYAALYIINWQQLRVARLFRRSGRQRTLPALLVAGDRRTLVYVPGAIFRHRHRLTALSA